MSRLLGVELRILDFLAVEPSYDEFDVPKKSGGFRHIEDPDDALKEVLRLLNDYLHRIRTRVADKLLGAGLERIQYSVFAGPLTDTQKIKLLVDMEKILGELPKSNFLLIPLSPKNIENACHFGEVPPDWEYLLGKRLTLFL
ncbi:CRISPR-associated endonuclease Cas2 [Emticicia fluvialis]|uniref:CRISPR-associated endonuclease Cas2 n=1 Tax=Emticicia fluvialis TaxID=2974474 RepID=UPI0021661204|nr:CRISPR-associated endonuclease Cas2 [Emticicia fluvialis]